ncbi:hypothetical protein B0H17DRAFT_304395 [Mycena rosella]|uniref:Uncharacterized protein n=1 Tax=Mycena rosella TaxID=1033263 RepID=A0AAD7CUR7_MYCRO|nr:hypothetical protein B0H17DRAFT_304395 [Mycena rosella]
MISPTFLILSFFTAARAANDWTKPCLTGICSYDLPSTNGSSSSGSIKIWGSQTAIGDITEAAGWKILGCSPDALSQNIRLVCMGGSDTSMCQHLYQGHGAVDTIVRLPESCGKGPFARVAKTWVPADQSIPASISARIVRRDGSQPQVQAITLDTNYAAVNNNKTGAVNLAIKGANVPGINDILANDTPASRRRSRLNRRQASNFVSDAADAISNAVSSANTINITQSKALPAADFSKKVALFEQTLSCPPISASASADVDATAHAVVTLGVAATGTIVPPKITDFSIIASLTADLTGTLDLTADLSGTLDSGTIQLFQTGIPGLDFPGILSIGPTFEVNVNAKATLDLNVDASIGINYHVEKAQLFFPPNGKTSGGSFSLGDTPLKLSADTSAVATGTVEGHIIPSINLGISALGVVDATVFLDLDASATMTLKVDGKAGASATIEQANSKRQDDEEDDSADGSGDDASSDVEDDSSEDAGDDLSDDGDDPTAADDGSDSDDATESADSSDDFGGADDVDPSTAEDGTNTDDADDSNDSDGVAADDAEPDTDTDTSGDTADPADESGATNESDPSDVTDDSSDSNDGVPEQGDADTDSSDSDAVDSSDGSGATDPSDTDVSTDSTTDDSTDDSTDTDSTDTDSTDTDSTDTDSTDNDPDDSSTAEEDASSTATSTDTDTATSTSTDTAASTSTDPATSTSTDTETDTETSTSIDTAAATSTDPATSTSTSSAPLASETTTADASFGGSFVISAGLDVNAGATGSFFGLFDKSTKVSLFKKDFELLSKNFGDASNERRSLPARRISRARRLALQSRALSCLSSTTEPVSLADESVAGKSL